MSTRSRNTGRTTVLLTGFGPFPDMPVNATMVLVPAVAERARLTYPGVVFVTEILPTEWAAAPARLAEMMGTLYPDVAIHFGVSPRARGFEIETRAVNQCAPLADACGALPAGLAVDPGGPDQLRTRLPAAHIVARLRALGIPAFLSRDAGTYLCNAVLYASLDGLREDAGQGAAQDSVRGSGGYSTETASRSPDQPAAQISSPIGSLRSARRGFVHVPASLQTASVRSLATARTDASGSTRLTWSQAVIGGVEIVGASLGRG
jgi:pyroglutamyl-peptidase